MNKADKVPVVTKLGVGWGESQLIIIIYKGNESPEDEFPRCWRRRLYNLVGVGRGQGAFRAVVLVWGTGEV